MTTAEKNLQQMNDLISLSKRRGFFFQSSEIYGGLGSCWDYGPLGVELKNKVKQSWWKAMTERQDVVGVDCSILMHPLTWKASGHIDNFSDPLVDCKSCKSRFRADKIDIAAPCPVCKESNSFTEARQFNLMFSTQMGAVVDDSSTVYLRPETAQGIFVNFQNVQQSTRKKLPFGIAQIGKAFRNEITPGNFIFRTREFEQMEMQYFVTPGEQAKFMQHWQETRWNWHLAQGLRPEKLRLHPHGPGELAHYADAALDIEYEFPMGWGEMEGVHSRTDFDLKQHEQYSKKNLHYVDQMNNNAKYIPYVIETSVGLDRHILALLCDAYREEAATAPAAAGEEQEEGRIVLKLKPSLAPVQAAILPLMKKAPQEEIGQKLLQDLKGIGGLDYDTAGSIGKRYRRQDEVGTPFCLTVDFDSPTDLAVTVRHRDSMEQERVNVSQLKDYLEKNI